MKIISHRGNLNGIIADKENNPDQIDFCINLGLEIEIDLRLKDQKPFLGHDCAQYEISSSWLCLRKQHLLVHVKEVAALNWIRSNHLDVTYFCHQNDDFSPISDGRVWIHNANLSLDSNCIIPLIGLDDIGRFDFSKNQVGGICSDYVENLHNFLDNKQIRVPI